MKENKFNKRKFEKPFLQPLCCFWQPKIMTFWFTLLKLPNRSYRYVAEYVWSLVFVKCHLCLILLMQMMWIPWIPDSKQQGIYRNRYTQCSIKVLRENLCLRKKIVKFKVNLDKFKHLIVIRILNKSFPFILYYLISVRKYVTEEFFSLGSQFIAVNYICNHDLGTCIVQAVWSPFLSSFWALCAWT